MPHASVRRDDRRRRPLHQRLRLWTGAVTRPRGRDTSLVNEKRSRPLGFEGWLDPLSRYTALGSVTAGAMVEATVQDHDGTVVRRGATFESQEHFQGWARRDAGIE